MQLHGLAVAGRQHEGGAVPRSSYRGFLHFLPLRDTDGHEKAMVKWFNERRAMAPDIPADPNLLERNRKILSRYYSPMTCWMVCGWSSACRFDRGSLIDGGGLRHHRHSFGTRARAVVQKNEMHAVVDIG